MMAALQRVMDWLRGSHDRESTQELQLALRVARDAVAGAQECTQSARRGDTSRPRAAG